MVKRIDNLQRYSKALERANGDVFQAARSLAPEKAKPGDLALIRRRLEELAAKEQDTVIPSETIVPCKKSDPTKKILALDKRVGLSEFPPIGTTVIMKDPYENRIKAEGILDRILIRNGVVRFDIEGGSMRGSFDASECYGWILSW